MKTLAAAFTFLVLAAIGGTILIHNTGTELAAAIPTAANSEEALPPQTIHDTSLDTLPRAPSQLETELQPATVTVGIEGAVPAALHALQVSGSLITAGHFSRQDMIRSITTERYGEILTSEVNAAALDMQFEIDTTDGFWMIIEPVTVRSEVLTEDRVIVEVWAVVVIATTEFGVGRETWQTAILDMVLVDGVWLVDSWDNQPGPAPAPAPSLTFASPAELGERMVWARIPLPTNFDPDPEPVGGLG